jgi:hypothetical protein
VDDTTAPAIRPIETRYAGCRFRSRLEARWAVFLNSLGIGWRYEPEGFRIAGSDLCYLPDFEILRRPGEPRIFLEVKPTTHWADDDTRKIWGLTREAGYCVHVVCGPPAEVVSMLYVIVAEGTASIAFCGQLYPRGRMAKALDAASAARFEFGESG